MSIIISKKYFLKTLRAKELFVFAMVLLIRLIYFFSYKEVAVYADSYGYFDYNFEKLLHLDFTDAGRTPVYPFILRILTGGVWENLHIVVIFQCCISFLSLFYFYGLAKLLSTNEKAYISLGVTFMYGASSMVFGWDNAILTESLALSGTVIFLWYIVKYLKEEKLKYFIKGNILLLFLIFLRPTFLLFNVILFAFLIIRFIFKKQETLRAILICVFSWIVIILYAGGGFYPAHGIFTISDPMPRQLMVICIEREYYLDYEDEEFVNMVVEGLSDDTYEDQNTAIWMTMWAVLAKYGQKETQEIAKECIKTHWREYLYDEADIMINVLKDNFYSYTNYKDEAAGIIGVINKVFNNIMPIHSLLIGITSLIIAFYEMIKKRSLDWLMIGFAVFICGIFFSTLIATCGEFIRTMIHIVPITYLAFLYYIGKYAYKNQEYIDTF